MICEACGFEATSGAALASHRRWRHRPDAPEGRCEPSGANLAALERTLAALRADRRAEPAFEARAQALRSLASALDENPANAQMWREYRESLKELTEDDGGDGAADQLLAYLQSPVGDAPEG